MTTDEIERVHYYERQYLQAADFRAEQTYHRDMRRRHNLAHHTWGIVTGLELVERAEGGTLAVYVQPGMAVDGYGREIVVLAPYRLDGALFERFNTLAHRPVWIGYDESLALPPGFGFESCEPGEDRRRTVESWRIVIDPGPQVRDAIVVDGRDTGPPPPANPGDLTVPADLSAPYQELPDDALSERRWLIRLGTVRWDGPNQAFLPADGDRLNEQRSYVGAVAAALLAPAGELRIAPRELPADPDAGEFAEVVGRLRVDGRLTARADVHLDGGLLRANYPAGDTDGVDLWLGRQRGPADVGHLLRIHLGDAPEASTALTIGPGEGAEEKAVLAVRADDVVSVPTGTASFGRRVRQMIDLWASTGAAPGQAEYGIGVQSSTLYQRTATQFCWFRGGTHENSANDPGAGGTTQMRLDSQARLHFESTTARQVLNLQGAQYGAGTQPSTLYLRSPGGFALYRGGGEAPTALDPGAGGVLALRVAANGDLSVFGAASATGNVTVGQGGNAFLRTRHIRGKSGSSDADDHLYLNWTSGRDVYVGQPGSNTANLRVAGNLFVSGADDSAFRVRSYTRQLRNINQDTPRAWTINLGSTFTRVFTAFAVLNGFSLWNNENNAAFSSWSHSASTNAIVQHCFVRVINVSNTQVTGECYCSESRVQQEADNTVSFTVVVVGRSS